MFGSRNAYQGGTAVPVVLFRTMRKAWMLGLMAVSVGCGSFSERKPVQIPFSQVTHVPQTLIPAGEEKKWIIRQVGSNHPEVATVGLQNEELFGVGIWLWYDVWEGAAVEKVFLEGRATVIALRGSIDPFLGEMVIPAPRPRFLWVRVARGAVTQLLRLRLEGKELAFSLAEE